MAFYKVPSNLKTSILAFVRHILPKKYTKALEIILTPCCKLGVASYTVDCSLSGTYTLNATFNEKYSLLGLGVCYINIVNSLGETVYGGALPYNDQGTVTFTGIDISSGTYNVSFFLYLPVTDTDSNFSSNGVIMTTVASIVFPSCP